MRARFAMALGILVFGATSVFAGPTSFNFGFGGPDTALGTSQSFTSNGATITAFGYECSAPSPSSTSTLSSCMVTDLFAKDDGPNETGLGLAGQGGGENEIGFDGTGADFVIGLDVSSLFKLGATSMTLSFGSVQPGESYAIFGYGSNPFSGSVPLMGHLVDGQLVGNDGSTSAQVFSSTIGLNASDEFLVFTSPCAASTSTALVCGSNVTLAGGVATTPEPGTIALFAIGLAMIGFTTRKRWATQRT